MDEVSRSVAGGVTEVRPELLVECATEVRLDPFVEDEVNEWSRIMVADS